MGVYISIDYPIYTYTSTPSIYSREKKLFTNLRVLI